MRYQEVIIVGAPRSGTNMLRDVLTQLPDFATWSCDEINFVWKHGNITAATDELPPERVRRKTRVFVKKQFEGVAKRTGCRFIVEKTCANSLRIPYVHELVPEARYLLLLRDGRDATASTLRRWRRPVPAGSYYLDKLRFVAPLDLPWVLGTALAKRLHGVGRRGRHSWSTWGPVFDELGDAVRAGRPLAEICALQWSRCVERSLEGLATVESSRWHPVSYERFVDQPAEELKRILSFLEAPAALAEIGRAVETVTAGSIGRWQSSLSSAEVELIEPMIERTMCSIGRTLGTEPQSESES